MKKHSRIVSVVFGVLGFTASCGDPIRSDFDRGQPAFVLHLEGRIDPRDEAVPVRLALLNERNLYIGPGSVLGPGRPAPVFARTLDGPRLTKNDRRYAIETIERTTLDAADTYRTDTPGGVTHVPFFAVVDADRAVLDHVLAFNPGLSSITIAAFGSGGDTLELEPGWQLFRRGCGSGGHPTYTPVPESSKLKPEKVQQGDDLERIWFARCPEGLAAPDVGAIVVPDAQDTRAITWAGGRIFYTRGSIHSDGRLLPSAPTSNVQSEPWATQVGAFDLTTGRETLLSRGAFVGPLVPVSQGKFLARIPSDKVTFPSNNRSWPEFAIITVPTDTVTGNLTALGVSSQNTVPSPDGRAFLVYMPGQTEGSEATMVRDTVTNTTSFLTIGRPLAWAPQADRILVVRERRTVDGGPKLTATYVIVNLSGREEEIGTFPKGFDVIDQVFWDVDGPQVLSLTEDRLVHINLSTQGITALLDAKGGLPSVRGAPAPWIAILARPDVVFSLLRDHATAFFWSYTCVGFSDALCTSRLHRTDLRTGLDTIVAVTRKPVPFAVSPDGSQLALGSDLGISVKPL